MSESWCAGFSLDSGGGPDGGVPDGQGKGLKSAGGAGDFVLRDVSRDRIVEAVVEPLDGLTVHES
jgi:hypothetical protein